MDATAGHLVREVANGHAFDHGVLADKPTAGWVWSTPRGAQTPWRIRMSRLNSHALVSHMRATVAPVRALPGAGQGKEPDLTTPALRRNIHRIKFERSHPEGGAS